MPDPDPHGEGRRGGQGGRAGARRGRLRDQALLHARAGLPGPGPPPSGRDGRWWPPRTAILTGGPVELDPDRHEVRVRGARWPLHAQGVRAARDAPRPKGRLLTRQYLIEEVWGTDYVGDTKTLDVHVKRLRQKIEEDPHRPTLPPDDAGPRLQVRRRADRLTRQTAFRDLSEPPPRGRREDEALIATAGGAVEVRLLRSLVPTEQAHHLPSPRTPRRRRIPLRRTGPTFRNRMPASSATSRTTSASTRVCAGWADPASRAARLTVRP